MNIVYKEKNNVKFDDIVTGQTFIYRNYYIEPIIYMKVSGSEKYNAVNLKNGILETFTGSDIVSYANFTLVEDYKE